MALFESIVLIAIFSDIWNVFTEKKLKYQAYLAQYQDCPPADFNEVERKAFRWVHNDANHANDFLPVKLISSNRTLEEGNICAAYGLSFFDSLENAKVSYLSAYKNRSKSGKEKVLTLLGSFIAQIPIEKRDGIANGPNPLNFGHFTFHEYEETNLKEKILKFFGIFNDDGTIKS